MPSRRLTIAIAAIVLGACTTAGTDQSSTTTTEPIVDLSNELAAARRDVVELTQLVEALLGQSSELQTQIADLTSAQESSELRRMLQAEIRTTLGSEANDDLQAAVMSAEAAWIDLACDQVGGETDLENVYAAISAVQQDLDPPPEILIFVDLDRIETGVIECAGA